ncbi:MAG: ATP-binding cassette domain-containing protein, partial [Pseudomonadota bacterium]
MNIHPNPHGEEARPGPSAARLRHREGDGLIIRGLGKAYRRRPVVRDVSFTLERGEVVGLLGPNGAGKTTCFYMVIGLIPADTGEIHVDGVDVSLLPMY